MWQLGLAGVVLFVHGTQDMADYRFMSDVDAQVALLASMSIAGIRKDKDVSSGSPGKGLR